MANAGRKNKYETHVKPRFEEIKEWLALGATDKEIIEKLGVKKSAFYDYVNKYAELSELMKSGRVDAINAIKAALFRRAKGYDYTEEKVIVSEKDGKRTELIRKHLPPDPACAMILLKHWAKNEGWTNDPQLLEIKKAELEIKKKEAERNNW